MGAKGGHRAGFISGGQRAVIGQFFSGGAKGGHRAGFFHGGKGGRVFSGRAKEGIPPPWKLFVSLGNSESYLKY